MARLSFLQHRRAQRMEQTFPYQAGVVASAATLNLASRSEARRVRMLRQGWQEDAMAYADAIGEIQFAHLFIRNCASRMRIYPAAYPVGTFDAEPVPIDDPAAAMPPQVIVAANAAMAALGSGRVAMANLMGMLSWNFSVVGEAFLHGATNPGSGIETWTLRSIDEMMVRDDQYWLREVPLDPQGVFGWVQLDPDLNYVARLWTPHPRFKLLATSSMRGILDSAEELMILSRAMRGAARSRLATAGVLKVPNGLEAFSPTDDNPDPQASPFMGVFANAMMAPIADEGVASAVVPIVVRGEIEALNALQHISMDRPLDPIMAAQRQELIGRIATGLDLPKEVLLGVSDLNHWPCSEDTEIYTESGWVTHEKLEAGTRVLSLDIASGLSGFEPITGVRREHVSDHEMIEITGRCHSSLTTPDHRWPVMRDAGMEWCHTEDFENNSIHAGCQDPRRMILGARSAEIPTEAKHSDAFVELVAWASTDADLTHVRGYRRSIRIRQRRVDNFASVRRALRGVEHSEHPDLSAGVVSWLLSADASEDLMGYGDVTENRWVVSDATVRQFTAAQLELFLATCERANGGDKDHSTVFAKDPARLAPIEAAALALGYRTTSRQRTSQTGFGTEPIWRLRWGNRTEFGPTPKHCRRVRYTGVIFCPKVPVGRSFLARRNGQSFFTGNTAWSVDDNSFRHHIEPHVVNCVDALTVGYLRMALAIEGIDPALIARIVCWYDPTELLTHPDRTQDAIALYGLKEISGETLRRVTGFNEDDKPSDIEVVQRLISAERTWPPNAALAILARLDPSLSFPAITTAGTFPGIKAGGIEEAAPLPLVPGSTPGTPALAGLPPSPSAGAPSVEPNTTPPPPAGPPKGPGGITASASNAARLSRRLQTIDADLRTRLQVAANAAVARVLDRAGAKLRTSVKRDARLSRAISEVDNRHVAHQLGQGVVEALGVSAPELLTTDWSDLAVSYRAWTQSAILATVSAASQIVSDAPDSVAALKLRAKLEAQAQAAWRVLETAVAARTAQLLYQPDPTLDQPYGNAVSPDSLVPASMTRAVLAVIGGTATVGAISQMANGTAPASEPMGQIGTGDAVASYLTDQGAEQAGYEWVHGSPMQPFEPHEDLDGYQFTDWDDDGLANTGDWPDGPYYFPGDHSGCSCDSAVQWEPGETGVESDGGDITLNDVGQEPVVRDADKNVVIPEGSRLPGAQYPIGQGPEG